MKVTIYFNASYPYGFASTNRVHNIAKGLVENDVNVEIIITNPTENHSQTLNNKTEGIYEAVKYIYLSNTTVRQKNIFFRKIIDFYCYFKLYVSILFNTNSDAIILIGGAFFDFRLLIPILTKLSKTKILLEINEYPYVNLQNSLSTIIKNYTFFKLLIPLFDGFIVISDALSTLLETHKINKSKILKISVLHEKVLYQEIKCLDVNTPFIIHSGSIFSEEKDGMLGCIKAFKLAKDKLKNDIKYIIVTNHISSSEIVIIKEYIKLNNMQNNVMFLSNLSKYELIKYYNNASLAIINKSDSVQNVYGFATKISEYVAFKIPLILTAVGDINSFFINDYNSIIIPPNDYKLLSDKIVLLLNDSIKAKELANNAIELSDTIFNPKIQGKRLVEFINIQLEKK